MSTTAGISHHEIPISDCNVRPSHNKKEPRKIYNYKKLDWDKIKEESSKFIEIFQKEYININVKKLEVFQAPHKFSHGDIYLLKYHKHKKQPSMAAWNTQKNHKERKQNV